MDMFMVKRKGISPATQPRTSQTAELRAGRVTHGAANPSVGLLGRALRYDVGTAPCPAARLLSGAAVGVRRRRTEGERDEMEEEESSVPPHDLSCPPRRRVL